MNKRYVGFGMLTAAAGVGTYIFAKRLSQPRNPPRTVSSVDLDQYLGEWYDIAHFPIRHQADCYGSQAFYSLNENGSIQVINTCYRNSNGQLKTAVGKAKVADPVTNAKIKVQFYWPFVGDYWIIELHPGYQWAVVSEPHRKNLWILSRTPQLDESTLDYILKRITEQGFDPNGLVWENHNTPAAFANQDDFVDEGLMQ